LNNAVGGSKSSQHMKGEAVDIKVPGISNKQLALDLANNILVTFDQIILEKYNPRIPTAGWVHVSICERNLQNRRQILTESNGRYLIGIKP